jgi:quercetin dioxygenase-like cupin family protein
VESGAFEVTIGGTPRRLAAGDSYLVAADVRHGAVCLEAGVLVDVFTPKRDDFV